MVLHTWGAKSSLIGFTAAYFVKFGIRLMSNDPAVCLSCLQQQLVRLMTFCTPAMVKFWINLVASEF